VRSALVIGAMLAAMSVSSVTAAGGQTRPALRAFEGPRDPRDIDLNDLVPLAGRIDAVWYVPAGRTRPQVAVAWHFYDRRPVLGWNDPRRYVLTLWNPEKQTPGSARWVPHMLIRAAPFELVGRAVRLADVTRDGHDDLLVTVLCSDCNHSTAVVSLYATFGNAVRRILGSGVFGVAKGPGRDAVVRGRVIAETAWGARHGLVWFDEPRGGTSVCCPAYRLQTFMRWGPKGWRTVRRKRVRPEADHLVTTGYPLP
jgi:hypothetical protein